MNLKEFGALKAGDKIESRMNDSAGTVTEVTETGVRVQWGRTHPGVAGMTFAYHVNSTAWMHWSKAEDETNSETATSHGA